MMRSVRRVKATQWLMALIVAAAPFSFFGCGDDDSDSGGSGDPGHIKVFVTNGAYTGNFPGGVGLVGADASCTDVATAAHLAGTWTAWLSDDTTDAIDRIFDGGTSYQLLNGTTVADSLADLTDGILDSPINRNEWGDRISGSFEVWTSTNADGTRKMGTCSNWTDGTDSSTAHDGRADRFDAAWTDSGQTEDCDTFNRLYCFADATSN